MGEHAFVDRTAAEMRNCLFTVGFSPFAVELRLDAS
jgi:hypothetical protein